jgi:hypothetical protein
LPLCGYLPPLNGPMDRAHLDASWLDCFTTPGCQHTRWYA